MFWSIKPKLNNLTIFSGHFYLNVHLFIWHLEQAETRLIIEVLIILRRTN